MTKVPIEPLAPSRLRRSYGVEVHLGHPREHEVQELGAVEAADLGVEVELLDDVAGVGVEGGDPGAQVAGHLSRS